MIGSRLNRACTIDSETLQGEPTNLMIRPQPGVTDGSTNQETLERRTAREKNLAWLSFDPNATSIRCFRVSTGDAMVIKPLATAVPI